MLFCTRFQDSTGCRLLYRNTGGTYEKNGFPVAGADAGPFAGRLRQHTGRQFRAARRSFGRSGIAKVVRTEVRQIRSSEYILAARCMGGGFFHILWRHLTPNFVSSIMFMVVMNVRSAIVAESTLSFMGIGLPLEVITWGSMLSLSGKALLSGAWWIILIPGGFLVAVLLCITDLGNDLRKSANQKQRNL